MKAIRFYTAEQDGLVRPWRGRVYLNAPFSQARAFVEKLITETTTGNVPAAVLLLNAHSVHTSYFQPLWGSPRLFHQRADSVRAT